MNSTIFERYMSPKAQRVNRSFWCRRRWKEELKNNGLVLVRKRKLRPNPDIEEGIVSAVVDDGKWIIGE